MIDGEVDFDSGKKLVHSGSKVYVFINSFADLELVKEAFGEGEISDIDLGEARGIMFEQSKQSADDMKGRFDNSLIVCPHGRSSLRFVQALAGYGVKAYSLHGGIEGLRSRS
jgi:rhodanese-related sulfurtransferase